MCRAGRPTGGPKPWRCAPRRCRSIGWVMPAPLGHPKLADYLLGDPVVTPLQRAAHCYTETLAHLPNCYLPADSSTIGLNAPPSRRDAGLPERWLRLLFVQQQLQVQPRGLRPLVSAAAGSGRQLPVAQSARRHRRGAPAGGSAGTRRRPGAGSSSRHESKRRSITSRACNSPIWRSIPFPYNSHSSGIDILYAGVPMVALAGRHLSRPCRRQPATAQLASAELIAGSVLSVGHGLVR
jgi:protein O-GlcNAc transferase